MGKEIQLCLVASVLAMAFVSVSEAASTLPPESKQLSRKFYKKPINGTCPNVETYVNHQVRFYWNLDKSITAKFLKLLYADCMVNGCDASILLDGPQSEKKASQNSGLGGFLIIDKIKQVIEERCPGIVSCADILNLATRDAIHLAGAPSYPVLLGRRDGYSSQASWVDLPQPSISWEDGLAYFQSKGLDILDYVTLLGGHSLGKTHCQYIRDRLYNFKNTGKPDPSMKKSFLNQLRKDCPKERIKGQRDQLVYLNPDSGSNYRFTNKFYSRVQTNQAVLGVDQELRYGNITDEISQEFAKDFEDLRKSFALSITRMGVLKVLTGSNGEVRKNCRTQNPKR
ncbi:probable peroxidase 26 [Impatiens glandulifera]|uniref:probable peroxidase 26 n=1 Tax=Impatiens glandulifera TaxID=253017 RepID=UPI001FB15F04|nr:probable peroxidase 26 [Impatiens glandulifera]